MESRPGPGWISGKVTELCAAARPDQEDAIPEETTMMTTETIPIGETAVTPPTSLPEAGEEVFGEGPEEEQGDQEEAMNPLGDRKGHMIRTVPTTRMMKRKMMKIPVKRLLTARRTKLPGLWKPHSGHVTRGSRLGWKTMK